jgi:ubiquinone/menaquinone biosynthesis C-methylase UbiE
MIHDTPQMFIGSTVIDILNTIQGGKILDVATGRGGFIPFLLENIQKIEEIIAIDNNARGEVAFQAFKDQPVHFQVMDAANLDFEAETFDTVCIANSLHHMADLPAVLAEMLRVLKTGGTFLVYEMYRDGQQETQLTHVHLHHWWAAIDTGMGIPHNETYTR